MAHRHLSVFLLLQVLEGETPHHELAAAALAHLRELCPQCNEAFLTFEGLKAKRRREQPPVDYGPAFEHAAARAATVDARLANDRVAAKRQLRELLDRRPENRAPFIAGARRRFRSPVLVELLVTEARTALRRDPTEALALLDLAEQIGRRVSVRTFGEAFVERMRVRVEAHRANALRVAGEIPAADAAWQALHERLARSPLGDVEAEAELASLEASLRQDQRRFDEATQLLTRAKRHYKEAGDREGVAKALIQHGVLCNLRGEAHAAVAHLRQAAESLDSDRSAFLYFMTQHNLALCLCELGSFEEAAEILARARPLYRECANPETLAMRTWLEGRIARGLGDVTSAERLLFEARNHLVSQRRGYSAALITVDLAEVYLASGRTAEVKRLAQALVEVFEAKDIHQEAARALALFQEAAVTEQVTLEMLGRLRAYLKASRANPQLPFRPGA